jgi:hypothetical protein
MLGRREEVLVYVSGITGFTHYSFLTILQIDLEQKHDNFPLPKFDRKALLQGLPLYSMAYLGRQSDMVMRWRVTSF